MLGLGMLLCAQSAGAWRQSRFVIGGGPDPPPTNVSYSNLNSVGVTFVHADTNEVTSVASAQKMASLFRANNLSCSLLLLATKTVAPDGDSVWGYFIHDEPRAREFPGLAKTVAEVRSQHPDALSFINLLGTKNFSAAETKSLYGVATYDEYVDSFIATVKPDILSYDCYPRDLSEMDNFHYNGAFMRNKSLHAGIPMWNYIWLESNGFGHGPGFYRWQLFVSAAYGSRGIMQWSVSPCGNIHACGPKDRWAPYPCLLDKHGQLFKPVANMARREHHRILALGPLLLQMDSLQVQRYKHNSSTPIIKPPAGMPLQSITGGAWLLGHFRSPQHGECVMVVNDDPVNTAFPTVNLGLAAAVREADQESGALVAVADEAPDVAGFQLFWDEGGGRLFCWRGNSTRGRHLGV